MTGTEMLIAAGFRKSHDPMMVNGRYIEFWTNGIRRLHISQVDVQVLADDEECDEYILWKDLPAIQKRMDELDKEFRQMRVGGYFRC